MSPRDRDREYERRRYSEWQERQRVRRARRVRRLQTTAVIAAVLVVVVGAGAIYWFALRDDTVTTADPGATDPPITDAANPCPTPTSTAAAEAPSLEGPPDPSVAENRTWTATLATSCGDITVELYGEQAPQAVANFVSLAQQGYFTGTPCHRLTVEGIFVLQCGDPTGTGTGGPGYSWGPIENAPADDVYPAGTLAMARVGEDGSSMGSQFFLVYEDSEIPSDSAGGYTVFGQITAGLEIVQDVAGGGVGADGVAPAYPVSLDEVTVQ